MHKQLECAQNESAIRSIHQPHPPISAVSDLGPVVCDSELVASTATVRPLVRVVESGADYAGQKKYFISYNSPGTPENLIVLYCPRLTAMLMSRRFFRIGALLS
jgi:hypothetical protein